MRKEVIDKALAWVERETFLKTKQSRMLSNGEQGELLQLLSLMIKPTKILELGALTGYSTICLSRGLGEGGRIDVVELNDELEDIMIGGYTRAGLINEKGSSVDIHFGDAKKIIPTLEEMEYDLVYIDANKREYCEYYSLVFDKIRVGGLMLADNVLWSGKVLLDTPPNDAQTQSIIKFNEMVKQDDRVEVVTLPIRDGLSLIYKR